MDCTRRKECGRTWGCYRSSPPTWSQKCLVIRERRNTSSYRFTGWNPVFDGSSKNGHTTVPRDASGLADRYSASLLSLFCQLRLVGPDPTIHDRASDLRSRGSLWGAAAPPRESDLVDDVVGPTVYIRLKSAGTMDVNHRKHQTYDHGQSHPPSPAHGPPLYLPSTANSNLILNSSSTKPAITPTASVPLREFLLCVYPYPCPLVYPYRSCGCKEGECKCHM
jgi:hypothetical protein